MANAALSPANLSATESIPAQSVAPAAKPSRAKVLLPALVGVAAIVGGGGVPAR